MKIRPHTRLLEEPVDLALMDPIVLRTVEQSKPVQYASRVRARIQEVEGEDMGLGPETKHPLSITQWWKANNGDLRVCTLYLEDVIPYTVNIRRSGLNKAIGQALHVPYLVSFSFSIFLVVVPEHRGPG